MTKMPEELLTERKMRIADAIQLKLPDRVPMFLPISVFGAKYAGIQDKLMPVYQVQLNAYAAIGEKCGLHPISGLA